MPTYKDTQRNSWYAKFRDRDWKGEVKWVVKRGFKTKREALQWERDYLEKKSGNPEVTFSNFVEVYRRDRNPRLKESTQAMKEQIVDTKLIPYFGDKKLGDISTTDVIQWQNELLSHRQPATGKPYSKAYLKTVHNQLSAIFNHAVRFYKLKENPAALVGNMGTNKGIQMKYWTKEQYLRFAEVMMEYPTAYYSFQVLYWTGIREGELLSLTPADVDLTAKTLSVTKTYSVVKGKAMITDPKTPKSIRTVTIPDFLVEELKLYMRMQYGLKPTDRLFPVSKGYLHHMMNKGSEAAGVPRIRIHDLRHSHVSLLIDLGFSAVAIADRMGHESIDITYRYAHMFPSVQVDMADKLNDLMEVEDHVG